METKFKYPDELGHFGIYGGIYVSETLMPAILELERAYAETKNDPLSGNLEKSFYIYARKEFRSE